MYFITNFDRDLKITRFGKGTHLQGQNAISLDVQNGTQCDFEIPVSVH